MSASDDGEIFLWDAQTGAQRLHLTLATDLTKARLSPDGKLLAALGPTKLALWDAQTGVERLNLTLEGHDVVFSPCGKYLAASSADGMIHIWDLTTTKELMVREVGKSPLLKFAPDSSYLAVSTDQGNTQFFRNPSVSLRTPYFPQNRPFGQVNSLQLNISGQKALVISSDGAARIWSLFSSALPIEIGAQDRIQIGRFSPSGDWVCTGARGGTVRLWHSFSGYLLAVMQGHQGDLLSIDFSADGGRVVTASADRTARIWKTDSGQLSTSLEGHAYRVNSVQLDSRDQYVLSASDDKTVRLWDLAKGRQISIFGEHKGRVTKARLSKDSSRALTISESAAQDSWEASVWNVKTGRLLARLESVPPNLSEVELSPDGRTVFATLQNPELPGPLNGSRCITSTTSIYRWDASTGKPLAALTGHTCSILQLKLSRDGLWLLTASADHSARIWDARTGESVQTLGGHTAAVTYADFSEDASMVITTSVDQTALVFRRGTEKAIHVLGNNLGPLRMAVLDTHLKGTPRAVALSEEGEAQLWDVNWERVVSTMDHGVEGAALAVFSEDGIRIGTQSKRGVVQLWDGSTGKLLARVPPVELGVTAVAFSRDALRGVTALTSGGLMSWDLGSGQSYPLTGSRREKAKGELSLLLSCRVPFKISGSTLRSENLQLDPRPECPVIPPVKQVGRWDYAKNAFFAGHFALQQGRFETARRHYQLAGRLYAEASYFHLQALSILGEAHILMHGLSQPILPVQNSYPANVQRLLAEADTTLQLSPTFGQTAKSVATGWCRLAGELRNSVRLPAVDELSELALSRCRMVINKEGLPASLCDPEKR